MNQRYRYLSHSATWATTTVRTTSSGGSRSAAATKKTVVVEYDWLAGTCTMTSWRAAAGDSRRSRFTIVSSPATGLRVRGSCLARYSDQLASLQLASLQLARVVMAKATLLVQLALLQEALVPLALLQEALDQLALDQLAELQEASKATVDDQLASSNVCAPVSGSVVTKASRFSFGFGGVKSRLAAAAASISPTPAACGFTLPR